MQQSSMQHPSPAQSSPSNGFFGSRASPLFSSVDHPDSGGDLPQTALCSSSSMQERDHAPPKQLAQSLEWLSLAIRQVSEIRSAADNLLEGLDVATWRRTTKEAGSCKPSEEVKIAIQKTHNTIDDFKATLRELEVLGVLHGAVQRYEDYQPWDAQTSVITTDGAMGAYAWKRQIAGQAAATAVDRTRLALKLFGEQKKRCFPWLETAPRGDEGALYSRSHSTSSGLQEQDTEASTSGSFLSELLKRIQSESPSMTVTPYGRLEWSRQACSRSSNVTGEKLLNPVKLENFSSTPGPSSSTSQGNAREAESKTMYMEKVSVLEVRIAGVLKPLISLRPMGSVHPDAIAVFAADEVGSHVHPWGVSQYKTYVRLSDYAVNALHHLNRQNENSALELLLGWLYSYRSLFTKACSTCQRTLALDPPTDLLLPPIVRSYRQLHLTRGGSSNKVDDPTADAVKAFHIGCVPWAQTGEAAV